MPTSTSTSILVADVPMVPIATESPALGALPEGQVLSYRRASIVPKPESRDDQMYASEANPEKFPDGGFLAYLVLFGSFCGLIADFGIPNSMGALEAYVSTHQLVAAKLSTVSWVFSLHLGVMFLGGVLFGDMFDHYGATKLLIGGTVLMCGGLMATAELSSMYQFILSFGVLTALGTSLAMAPLIGVLSHWFLKKRAMACSIATVGGLVGSSMFALVLQKLFAEVGFKWGIRVLALICLVCMLLSIAFVKERREETVPEGDQSEPHSADQTETELEPASPFWDALRSAMDLALFKDIRFVSLAIAVFVSEINSITVLTFLASYALANGVQTLKAYLLITLVNLFGIPARLLTGFLADRYGRFNVMFSTSLFSAVFTFGLLVPAKGELLMLYSFVVLFGFLSSAVISLIAPCLGQICPAARFGKYYGVLYFCLAFLTVLGIFFTSLVIDTGSQHRYQMWTFFEAGVSVAAIFAWGWARYCNVGFRVCKF